MKRVQRYFLLACWMGLLLILAPHAFSQNITVSGKVIDSRNNNGLAGASVQVKGSSTGTVTNEQGSYSIVVPSQSAVLVFSYSGLGTQEIKVGNRTSIDVQMTATQTSMDEVVVIGYGTAKKSDLTGSVGSVKAAQLQERPAPSLNQAIAGRVPGVQVNTNSGRPGGQTTMRIRGFSSINSSNNPLYIIDGIQLPVGTQNNNSNSIDFINPNDIASVEILKDASATAIYGARGANGVVMVTTKKGTSAGPRLTYDMDLFVPTIGPHRVEMLNAKEYLQVENLAYDNIKVYDPAGWAAGNYASLVDPREKRKNLPLLFDANGNPLYDTDWLKESTQNKIGQNHQLGFSGGNQDNTYGLYLGYRNDQGLLLNSYLKRYSARFTLDSKVKDWLKIGGSLSYNNQEENIVDQGTGGLNSVRMITESFPFLPVKYADGTWAENYHYPGAEGGSNPVHILSEREALLNTQNLLGEAHVNIYLAKGLEFRSQLGANIVTRGVREYNGRTLDQISRSQNGIANVFNNRESYWSSENYFTYRTSFGSDHDLNAMAGMSWQETNIFNMGAGSQNFSTDYFEYNNIGAGSQQNPGSSSAFRFAFNSFFGRVNYTFKDKYLLTLTGRADGSDRFGPNNKYSFFPSAALAWRVSDEPFLENSNLISNLKLRTSYGFSGNSEIGSYRYLPSLGTYAGIFSDARVTGIGLGRLGNADLQWEKTAQADAGFELGLLNNRINLEMDFYYRKTTDMLLDAPVPRTSGAGTITKNIGSMENKGIELGLNTVNISKRDFTWSSTFNVSFNRNKVLTLATPAPIFGVGNPGFTNQTGIIRVGDPVGSFWGLVRLGTWSEKERAEAAKFTSYRGGKTMLPGDIKYLDVNGDYEINDADRMIIGNGNPDAWGSFINNFRYKNFELILDIQYCVGNDVLNMTKHSGEDRVGIANSYSSVLGAYTPQNENSMIAAIRDTKAGYVTNVDTRWIEDGSFLRGRNLLLAYNFSPEVAKSLRLSRLRMYVSAQNFFLSTKFSGNDPEVTTYSNPFAQGQTFFDYPKPTIYTFGLNVSL
ncbi:SusC/RagA family TonB-linked outer membrane protein [Flavihumibacter solisilvae]|uniref:Collagen-binding protein n=1 Tax=Flavihumibacter solisilvae TaxID=1349421 RepID=A0A0C1IPW6_9BACT|nr:TonB-dependent receptor [Flavihumibacter solisilvae]KIC96280.1 collagen-binding protein [Flavihumibacter solisilvae]